MRGSNGVEHRDDLRHGAVVAGRIAGVGAFGPGDPGEADVEVGVAEIEIVLIELPDVLSIQGTPTNDDITIGRGLGAQPADDGEAVAPLSDRLRTRSGSST